MKKIILVASLLLFMGQANAGTVVQTGAFLNNYHPLSDGSIFFKVNQAVSNPFNCGKTYWYKIDATNPLIEEYKKMMFVGLTSNVRFAVYVYDDQCNDDWPAVKSITMTWGGLGRPGG